MTKPCPTAAAFPGVQSPNCSRAAQGSAALGGEPQMALPKFWVHHTWSVTARLWWVWKGFLKFLLADIWAVFLVPSCFSVRFQYLKKKKLLKK